MWKEMSKNIQKSLVITAIFGKFRYQPLLWGTRTLVENFFHPPAQVPIKYRGTWGSIQLLLPHTCTCFSWAAGQTKSGFVRCLKQLDFTVLAAKRKMAEHHGAKKVPGAPFPWSWKSTALGHTAHFLQCQSCILTNFDAEKWRKTFIVRYFTGQNVRNSEKLANACGTWDTWTVLKFWELKWNFVVTRPPNPLIEVWSAEIPDFWLLELHFMQVATLR